MKNTVEKDMYPGMIVAAIDKPEIGMVVYNGYSALGVIDDISHDEFNFAVVTGMWTPGQPASSGRVKDGVAELNNMPKGTKPTHHRMGPTTFVQVLGMDAETAAKWQLGAFGALVQPGAQVGMAMVEPEVRMRVTLDAVTINAKGAKIETRLMDSADISLDDFTRLARFAGAARFSTSEVTGYAKILSADKGDGTGSILTIEEIDDLLPTIGDMMDIGLQIGVEFESNPYLAQKRRDIAEDLYNGSDFDGRQVATQNGWETDTNEMVRDVFLENGDEDSQLMRFRVSFKPGSMMPEREAEFTVPEPTTHDAPAP